MINIEHRTLNPPEAGCKHRIWYFTFFIKRNKSEAIPLSTLDVGRSMFDVHFMPKTNPSTKVPLNRVILISIIAVCLLWAVHAPVSQGKTLSHFSGLDPMLGDRDAVMVAAPDGRVLFAHQPGAKLVPASTTKLLTALAAFHYLGPDFRFVTKFYLDGDSSLKIEGQGDPLLISEVIEDISKTLAKKLDRSGRRLNHIVLDNTYFKSPIPIPGVSGSSEPYDAPNGALCVNFNTVNFKTDQGTFVSAEPQTPLLPMVLPGIKATGLEKGRVTLSHTQDEITYYAGHLFRYFLGQNGQGIQSAIKIDSVGPRDRLFLTYRSVYTLTQTVMKMG